ncbi:unnamed protein product [Effrenium voratum]|nr:unnamed protein product [Effrenium voratum]
MVQAAVAYCSAASRRKKHVRKDRYEKNMNEYLITEHEAATYEQINEKTLREETQISRDRVGSVDLAAPEPEGVLLDGSHSETCSDSGSEGSPKKGKKHRSGHKKQKKDEVEEERIMEASLGVPLGTMHASKIAQAAESISEVMNQLLKCQAKLELTASKLEMMNTDAGLNVHIAALMSGHDDLANYKAELDTRGKLPEQASRAQIEENKLKKTILKNVKRAVTDSDVPAETPKGASFSEQVQKRDTFLTRILFSVMMTKTYARNKAPLYALLSHFADSCTNAFENGIEVVINDQRQTGYAWHEWDDSAAWLDTMDTVTLIEELRIYGEGSVAKRLDAVYSDLVVWNWFKGADTTVLTSFLQWRCERALADYDDEHEDYLQWITDALQVGVA